jgi:hypothetical protein
MLLSKKVEDYKDLLLSDPVFDNSAEYQKLLALIKAQF